MPKNRKKKASETVKSIKRQMKSLENKEKRLFDKIWKTRDKGKRDVMHAEITSLRSRMIKLSKKKGKLLTKEIEERREKRRKK